jgi:hypothetical protein
MKSDLKFLECAGEGAAVLAARTVYEESLVHRETGLLYATSDEFTAGLMELIEDAPLRRRLAANAYAWAAQHRMLSRHFRERLDWYARMRAELPRLNAELRQRAPVLFTG